MRSTKFQTSLAQSTYPIEPMYHEELFALCTLTSMEYSEYVRLFKDLWTTWIQLRTGLTDEWFKMNCFKGPNQDEFFCEGPTQISNFPTIVPNLLSNTNV